MHARSAFIVLFMLGMMVACGDDNPAPTGPTAPQTSRTLDSLRITTSDSDFVDGGQVLRVGETMDLTACAVYSDQTEDCGITATWTSLDTSIATVVNGTVTAVAPGEVEIRASYRTASVTTEITVQAAAAVPERLSITGPEEFLEDHEIEVGQTVQLGADLEMSDGSVQEDVSAEWTSSNTTVASVNSSGLVTARQAGGFDIRATAEGLSARLTGVRAVAPPQPNRAPTATVSCDPCEVEVEDEVLLRANASDPDGDPLSYSWSAPVGRFIGSTSETTARWRAPDQAVPVQITVEVTDGRGASASGFTTVRVNDPSATGERWRGIRVAPEAGRSGYQRPSWNVRDTDIHRQDGSPPCTAYTRTRITNVGPGDGLDREHIVALAEAWDSRPPGFQQSVLRLIAEDHDNLTLATASANRSKSDRDAAEWRPEHNGAWMAHRVVEVKREYDLSVDPAERDWLERLFGSGPDEIACGQGGSTDPDHPPVRTYRNCAAMRDAGWNRGVSRNGGTYRAAWDEAEKDTYALNTARDRDRDGHACE